jgi:hypothetical protein
MFALKLPFAPEDLAVIVGIAAALAALGLAITAIVHTWRIRRIPVGRLLAEGG